MTDQQTKAAVKKEGNSGPMTAEQFREMYVKEKNVTSPAGKVYRVRAISTLDFLSGPTSQLLSIKEKTDEAIAARKKLRKGDKAAEEDVAKKEITAAREVKKLKAAMAPVLCAGMVQPKVIEPNVLMRPRTGNELTVDEFLIAFEEATFVYTQILNLSLGGLSSADGGSFPVEDKPKGGA